MDVLELLLSILNLPELGPRQSMLPCQCLEVSTGVLARCGFTASPAHRRRMVITSRDPADSLWASPMSSVRGFAKYQGETMRPAAKCACQAVRSPFARASSRCCSGSNGRRRILKFSAIAFCDRQRYLVGCGTETERHRRRPCRRRDSARVEPGAAACCRLWHWRE